jgi:hypothetical protein
LSWWNCGFAASIDILTRKGGEKYGTQQPGHLERGYAGYLERGYAGYLERSYAGHLERGYAGYLVMDLVTTRSTAKKLVTCVRRRPSFFALYKRFVLLLQ